MLGINFKMDKRPNKFTIDRYRASYFWFLYRLFNKIKLYRIRDKMFDLNIYYEIKTFNNDNLIAMIGDKSHKLLQQALGQEIEGNQYYLEKLFFEAEKREIKSKIFDWGKQVYNDYLNNDVYKYLDERVANDNSIDIDRLNIFLDILRNRQSIRKFAEGDIPNKVIKKLLTCGIHAPSSCNRQSWKYITFTKKIDKQYIATIRNVKFLENTPLIICVLVDIDVYTSNSQGDVRITPIMDGSAAIINIINGCEAAGLASCWVNFVASVGDENMDSFKEHFSIPINYVPISLVAVGKILKKHPKPLREDLSKYWVASY